MTERVEITGNIRVHHPVREAGWSHDELLKEWWAPHTSPDCDAFRAPRADCTCGGDVVG